MWWFVMLHCGTFLRRWTFWVALQSPAQSRSQVHNAVRHLPVRSVTYAVCYSWDKRSDPRRTWQRVSACSASWFMSQLCLQLSSDCMWIGAPKSFNTHWLRVGNTTVSTMPWSCTVRMSCALCDTASAGDALAFGLCWTLLSLVLHSR